MLKDVTAITFIMGYHFTHTITQDKTSNKRTSKWKIKLEVTVSLCSLISDPYFQFQLYCILYRPSVQSTKAQGHTLRSNHGVSHDDSAHSRLHLTRHVGEHIAPSFGRRTRKICRCVCKRAPQRRNHFVLGQPSNAWRWPGEICKNDVMRIENWLHRLLQNTSYHNVSPVSCLIHAIK